MDLRTRMLTDRVARLLERSRPPTGLTHALIITGSTPDEREWEVKHPPECPIACDVFWNLYGETIPSFDGETCVYPYPMDGHRTCYVEFEVDYSGIDSLDVYSLKGDAHLEGPKPKWGIDEWKMLRPGRYELEGWYHSGEGMGEYGGQGDPDGGLNLLSWEPE